MRSHFAFLVVVVCAACEAHPRVGGTGAAGSSGAGTAGTTGEGGTAGSIGGATGTGGGPGGATGDGPGGTAGGVSTYHTLTEWTVPFSDTDVFQIAAAGDSVFYLTKDAAQRIGRLDVTSGMFTEWTTPYTATSPGGIAVRATDGAVFMTGATLGEIGRFDPQTGLFTRWAMPADLSSTPGPFSLAFDQGTGVFFTAIDMLGRSYVGRFDTATGDYRTWTYAGATASSVVAAPDGTVLFNCWDGSVSYQIARLDPATGFFTHWVLPSQPLFPMVGAADGTVFFEEQSADFTGVARLIPATGLLTEWSTAATGTPADSMSILSGRVYFGFDGPSALQALDPSAPGHDSSIHAAVSLPDAMFAFHLSADVSALSARQAVGKTTQGPMPSQISGAFETWAVSKSPRMTAAIPGAIYFTEDSYGAIARLTP